MDDALNTRGLDCDLGGGGDFEPGGQGGGAALGLGIGGAAGGQGRGRDGGGGRGAGNCRYGSLSRMYPSGMELYEVLAAFPDAFEFDFPSPPPLPPLPEL